MSGVVGAFATLVAVALLGYLAGLLRALRPADEVTLSRLVFLIGAPALLFTTVSTADLASIFSPVLVTNLAGVLVVQAVFLIVAGLIWRRGRAELIIGTLAGSYVNAGILGISIGVYVLDDGALIVPVILFQLAVLAPIAFLLLGGVAERRSPGGASSVRRILLRPLRTPMTVAVLLGLVVAVTGLRIPDPVMRPIELVADAAVPVALLAYGLSLSGRGRMEEGGHTRDMVLVVTLKCFVQPTVAYLTGRYLLHVDDTILLAATLFAALPTAQNIYVYAVHYNAAKRLARRAVLLSTLVSIPVMTLVGGVLG
ncbi:AEC family transporter [Thermostaphylospora chromogena]|jgi:malonate transporter and related proteins|uniref:AEC family transporter n=1 Tax=Thermostaphylospora chromogena TaxID=35622 RepID=A0A1H1CNM4_9ACTN|nr:AEC family transporter [Thermostaphylospora chromogena]SDQ65847.1 hypothetical protein SAMN04489764_1569 [Thermostaphylospora chromogena]